VSFPLARWPTCGLFVTDEIVPDSIENPLYFRTGSGEEKPYGDATAASAYQAVDAGWLKDQWDLLMEQSVTIPLPPNRGYRGYLDVYFSPAGLVVLHCGH
jgi:hypothetical protein